MQSKWTTIYWDVVARHCAQNICFAKWSSNQVDCCWKKKKIVRSKTDETNRLLRSVPLKDLGHRKWFALELLIKSVGFILSVLSSRAIGILLVHLNDMYFCFPLSFARRPTSQLIYRFFECESEFHMANNNNNSTQILCYIAFRSQRMMNYKKCWFGGRWIKRRWTEEKKKRRANEKHSCNVERDAKNTTIIIKMETIF